MQFSKEVEPDGNEDGAEVVVVVDETVVVEKVVSIGVVVVVVLLVDVVITVLDVVVTELAVQLKTSPICKSVQDTLGL